MNFLNRLFKREKINPYDYEIPSYYDELTEMIFDFVDKNRMDNFTTQLILSNGKSVLILPEMRVSHAPRGVFISIYDKDGVEVAIVRLHDISTLGRVPKGKHHMG